MINKANLLYFSKFTTVLISKDRKTVKIAWDLLTGHCKCNMHLKLMVLTYQKTMTEAMCRFCSSKKI